MARRKRHEDHMLLVPGETVNGRLHQFVVDRIVGGGSYASVYAARDQFGRKVALKEFFPARHPREAPMLKALFERERHVLSLVSPHPLMPGFYEGFEADQHFYLAQEFIEGKTLEELIAKTKLTREWMLRWAVSLCYALSYVHNLEVVHHDLKPANIKIRPDGHLALLDFGAARYFGPRDASVPDSVYSDDELYGTEGYLPPELDADGNFSADVRTDIFALGCILYEMVMGDPPEQKSINERNQFITTPLMSRKDIDLAYTKLVTTALSYNTEYRYASAQMFLDALRPISPPVFLTTTKQLLFGRIEAERAPVSRKFSIFNAGSGGEFTGDVRSKVPWLKVEMPSFRASRREFVVTADPSLVTMHNEQIHGDLEIWAAEKRDEDNHVVSPSERWVIECRVFVAPRPANVVLLNTTNSTDGKLLFRVRKGAETSLPLSLHNDGETCADVSIALPPNSPIKASPLGLQLNAGETAYVHLTHPALAEAIVDQELIMEIRWNDNSLIKVPVSLKPASVMDSLKSLFGR